MANRLAAESSPYLLQHADNPVDWFPWGEEAFEAAAERDVPILLSIGYSTCHWCHVMARESFEDRRLAAFLNEHFVAVKVDREERPDVDAVHMRAAQAMGVRGGWPLTVFLTPDGLPVFAGTYWPPEPRGGMPGFLQVLGAVAEAWRTDRRSLLEGADRVAAFLRAPEEVRGGRWREGPLGEDGRGADLGRGVAIAVETLRGQFDRRNGGFGGAPKFPQPPLLTFLLRHHARTGAPDALAMVEQTLAAMARGGIHDQLGGGFARYSVDARWKVPHFEKMLYDNAQLLELYADLAVITGKRDHRDVAERIVAWLEREMLTGGAFAAGLDADSEGVEGRFYVWTEAEVDELLEPGDAALVKAHYGIRDPGEFEGATVLRVAAGMDELAAARGEPVAGVRARIERAAEAMHRARSRRVPPARDDKVVAGWNALAIHALAHAGRALGQGGWVARAEAAASFVLGAMRGDDGALARTFARGRTSGAGVLEDHAAMARALLTLYGATGEERWRQEARQLLDLARDRFRHETGVGYHDTDATDLFARPRDLGDGVTPSGNALMAEALLALGTLENDESLRQEGETVVRLLL
ncbi:MAG: thioredoxin domain-containing protein, partial [Actinomycetes bacterium]|nr:thioredoxin domain-containing protein [Actinomycetes bacterium]MDX5380760.1 thioredoxin domain-containing protein [Actinomycetes bacterium]MDX5399771.1 thioredoxin domain-containing protein [Actinomycetes bacterium]MDX5450500.1 thioredoxin domain-containing protein [Actinomycetes bacterium]